ncbi:MAG: OmpH family outer membrane protein [Bacteroidota bacterium]
MKKNLLAILCLAVCIITGESIKAQTFKAGVFDIDLMVQAMPGYHTVDSLVQIYEADSLGAQYQIYEMEYQRLDSTYKLDSALYAAGKKSKAMFDYTTEERRKMGLNLVYWQQIAQNKSNSKRGQLAKSLYQEVAEAYKKVIIRKKYNLILKPQTYEAGFPIENVFLAVARELKLSQLPQELLYLGDDPDVSSKPPATKPGTGTKPKTN